MGVLFAHHSYTEDRARTANWDKAIECNKVFLTQQSIYWLLFDW